MADHTPQPPLPPDRHPGWEGLYLASEIRRCVDLHQPAYDQWRSGGSTPSLVLDANPADDLSARNQEVVDIVGRIERLFSAPVLAEALGIPGEPGDDEKIAAVAAGLGAAFGDLVDWALRARGAEAPSAWRGAYGALSMIVATPLGQIRSFADGFLEAATDAVARQRSGEDVGQQLEMTLTVSIPEEDVATFSRALAAVVGTSAAPSRGLVSVAGPSRGGVRHLLGWMLVGVVIAVSLRALGLVG